MTDSELLKKYPNLNAIFMGCISGNFREWPLVKRELRALIQELDLRDSLDKISHRCLVCKSHPAKYCVACADDCVAAPLVHMYKNEMKAVEEALQETWEQALKEVFDSNNQGWAMVMREALRLKLELTQEK